MRENENNLGKEKSPYLLQHALNPVAWQPWGPTALAHAKKENKPIFLSIGYSTCHWCHVMAHESFEDQHVAALLNATFVNIKVDREERPDIDGVYMTVCQMMTGSGGWPLSIFLTPDKKPFFAATYIPKESRFGRMGLLELIPKIDQAWGQRRADVLNSAEEITAHLRAGLTVAPGDAPAENLPEQAFTGLANRFDDELGGFGEAPKFPTPHNLLFLLRWYHRTKNLHALEMVEKTLNKMRRGGIYDQIGFGFHRYSTDRYWRTPHFEKMLYDQALLAIAYAEAFQLTRNQFYAETVREIFTYVQRDMTAPDGGFYSAEDADSEGEEGKFYLWEKAEIEQLVRENAGWFCSLFDIRDEGNFVDEATHYQTGVNILYMAKPVAEVAAEFNVPVALLLEHITAVRQTLFAAREQRIHPHKDDKILTDWNGLMIAALALAGRILVAPEYLRMAERAAAFISRALVDKSGRLLHRYRDGQAAIPAYAEDYAFFIWGLLELFQSTQNVDYLRQALALNDDFIAHFWDNDGGFFTTADDGENLLVRQKEIYDGAVPSANSVALLNLLRLARLTGDNRLEVTAAHLARAFSAQVAQLPSAHTFFMSALEMARGPAYEVVIAGDPDQAATQKMLAALDSVYVPNKVVLLKSPQNSAALDSLANFVLDYQPLNGRATAYVCQNLTCHSPTNETTEMLRLLAGQ